MNMYEIILSNKVNNVIFSFQDGLQRLPFTSDKAINTCALESHQEVLVQSSEIKNEPLIH